MKAGWCLGKVKFKTLSNGPYGPVFYAALRFHQAVVWVVNWPVQKSGRIGLADDINSYALDDIGLHKGM